MFFENKKVTVLAADMLASVKGGDPILDAAADASLGITPTKDGSTTTSGGPKAEGGSRTSKGEN